jgi:hypothetical protein
VARKSLPNAFSAVIIVSGLILVGTVHFDTVIASTNVSGIISSDTTWTQAESPYIFTGNILVNEGVTLTVEPGATINFGGYYLRVNGTLSARGTSKNKITFTIDNPSTTTGASAIEFKSSGSSWNEQTNSGSIIENTIINSKWDSTYITIEIEAVSPKIVNNIIDCNMSSFSSGSSFGKAISNLLTNSATISNNTILGEVTVTGGIFNNNTMYGRVSAIGGSVCNNTIRNPGGEGITLSQNATVYGNTVLDSNVGISASIPASSVNSIALAQENFIFNNNYGVQIQIGAMELPALSTIAIKNNTIINNSIGIYVYTLFNTLGTQQILYNNIHSNHNYNFKTTLHSDLNATNNWWGTADPQTINETIYDFWDDYNLGKVNFDPFLNEANP